MSKHDKILNAMRVDGKHSVKLSKCDSGSTDGIKDKKEARELLEENTEVLDTLQYALYAESKKALLVVFQALDTAGKDGVIRKVFGPLNPQGVEVNPFKRPSDSELAHDYLWRVHARVPSKGTVGIFNRSHYEDVLVHRVHKLLPKRDIDRRYGQINDFENYLSANGVTILKFFLHISKDEQKRRLQARLDDKDKRWKFEMGDLAERKLWDRYQEAYQAVLDNCSTGRAPWFVIPADNKWYRDWAVSSIIVDALRRMNPRIPEPKEALDGVVIE